MLCRNPFMKGVQSHGCGQCLNCRINHQRLWAARIELESLCHAQNSFVTLTYNQENLPYGPAPASLIPDDYRKFLYQLRQRLRPRRIRYFAVGEYGDLSDRPHFHLALFGVGREDAPAIEASWKKGFVHIGDITPSSAQYIAGYTTKRLTRPDDPALLGRHPEFARPSLKPGIGALALPFLVEALTSTYGAEACVDDVPGALKIGGRSIPLGRYLRRKTRELYGFGILKTDKDKLYAKLFKTDLFKTPGSALAKHLSEVHAVLENARLDPKNQKKSTKEILVDINAQPALNQVTRYKIRKAIKQL